MLFPRDDSPVPVHLPVPSPAPPVINLPSHSLLGLSPFQRPPAHLPMGSSMQPHWRRPSHGKQRIPVMTLPPQGARPPNRQYAGMIGHPQGDGGGRRAGGRSEDEEKKGLVDLYPFFCLFRFLYVVLLTRFYLLIPASFTGGACAT